MKSKKILMMLITISVTKIAVAQQTITELPSPSQSKTNVLFNSRKVGSLRKRFDFLFPAGNKMMLEFTTDNQVDSLPDIDSLIGEVWKDLSALGDSINSPLASKRIDVIFSPVSRTIRVQDFPQRGNIFQIRKNDINQLKVEQDTLRLSLFTRNPTSLSLFVSNPYYLTFIVNHISDIPFIVKQNSISETVQIFRKDFAARRFRNKSASFTYYYALYDVAAKKRLTPAKGPLNSMGRKIEFIPYVQTGIQYLRGAWAPSAGVGMELINKQNENLETRFRLFWEPYFIFNRDSLKSASLSRNDFLTFQYHLSSKYKGETREIDFHQSFSIGYLIRKKGNFFEANTFKVSLPGLQTKNILLEPEFVFNDFFKNVSPSLKLTLFLE